VNSFKPADPMKTPKPKTLAELAAETARPVDCSGHQPIDLTDSGSAWYVEKGSVDLFIVERKDGIEQAAPQHLLRAKAGRLLPGMAPDTGSTTLGVIARGLPGTLLRRLPMSDLVRADPSELAGLVDWWAGDISSSLSRYDTGSTRISTWVDATEVPMTKTGVVSSRHGVVWVSGLAPGDGLYLGLIDPQENPSDSGTDGGIPLVRDTWILLTQSRPLSIRSSLELIQDHLLVPALAHFHKVAFTLERLNRSLAVVDQVNLERERITNRQSDEVNARHQLFDLYDLSRNPDHDSGNAALQKALEVIGLHEGIDFTFPEPATTADFAGRLAPILDASGVRARRVRLSQVKKWWRHCGGAMLAFRETDGQPVALLPGRLGGYREVDPAKPGTVRMTGERARALRTEAWLFYQPLTSSSAGLYSLFRLACRGSCVHFVRFFILGFLGSLILLIPPVLLGLVVDEVIPGGEAHLLYTIGGFLAGAALIGASLHVLQGMALMRIEGRAATRAETAFWDRLLRLPMRFLQRYSAGELALRGMTFQTLRDALQRVAANGVLSLIFLPAASGLVFAYDPALGGITAIFGMISLIVTLAFGVRQMSPNNRMVQSVQNLAGRFYELVHGISILRVEGAEGSAFALWARGYRKQKRAELDCHAVEEHRQAFNAAAPLLAGAVLLGAVSLPEHKDISIGDFLVIYMVFLLMLGAVARLGHSFGLAASFRPAINQVRPFLSEIPEMSAGGETVNTLTGDIRFDHVSFRYEEDGPLILDDVSIHAGSGEFVAITGESGSGKSTLVRLLLGLEKPVTGAVYYDGRDLAHLNLKQVRRQIGVIPQSVQLHPEDIWDNIVGGHENVSGEAVWRAARQAAVDQEISAMPMRMLTCVGAGVGVTSGGESQRILIARALVNHPRILLLDEATNWLDNETQTKVMENLSELNATRIIIAHRLSALHKADRIYVMQSGRVAEEGSFAELMETKGVFRDLVERQLA